MALVSLYARGKISETDTALKKNRYRRIVLLIGVLCTPLGAWILIRALNTFSKALQPHTSATGKAMAVTIGKA